MKKFYFFIFFLLLLFFSLVLNDFIKVKNLKNKHFNINKIDAIVVLTGSKGRIGTALKFIPLENIKYIIISGANPLSSKKEILNNYTLYKDFFFKVIIENKSKNTLENAIEVKKMLKQKSLKNILLITSLSHGNRTKFIFKKVFYNSKINISFYFIPEKITFKKVVKERLKYIFDYMILLFYQSSD